MHGTDLRQFERPRPDFLNRTSNVIFAKDRCPRKIVGLVEFGGFLVLSLGPKFRLKCKTQERSDVNIEYYNI